VSHIPKFKNTSKSPSGDAVVSHWGCIISFRDAHRSYSHPHLPQETLYLPREMCSHLQIAGYVTLLIRAMINGLLNKPANKVRVFSLTIRTIYMLFSSTMRSASITIILNHQRMFVKHLRSISFVQGFEEHEREVPRLFTSF
jgi:hypothetical protein